MEQMYIYIKSHGTVPLPDNNPISVGQERLDLASLVWLGGLG
jgi:hypothetical protein